MAPGRGWRKGESAPFPDMAPDYPQALLKSHLPMVPTRVREWVLVATQTAFMGWPTSPCCGPVATDDHRCPVAGESALATWQVLTRGLPASHGWIITDHGRGPLPAGPALRCILPQGCSGIQPNRLQLRPHPCSALGLAQPLLLPSSLPSALENRLEEKQTRNLDQFPALSTSATLGRAVKLQRYSYFLFAYYL